MKSVKFWLAVVVAAIVINTLDFVAHGILLADTYSKIPSMRTDNTVPWLVFGDCVAVFVLAWIMLKVGSVFGSGVAGGAKAGFFLGIFASFPTFHFQYLIFAGIPYWMAWAWTGLGVVWYVVAGAIIGALLPKKE